MEEWKEYKLGEIAQIQTGPFGSQLHKSDYVDDGVPCIMPTNIGKNLDVISDGIAHISENDAQRLSRHLVTAGDIIYARRGDIEKCAYIQEQQNGWFCGTGCLRIRINKDADSHFIAYQLSTSEAKSWIVGNAVGTTMLNLNSSILSDLPVLLPSLFTQRHITAILKSLDDKIEVNRRINENLEQQAQALFKSWFVDFEPFKDGEFVESELGMIPKGCSVKKLMNICTIKYGKGISKNELVNEGFPVFGGNGIIGFHEKYLYELPQILVSCRGAASGKIMESYPMSFVTSNSLVLELFNRLYYNYLKCYLMRNPLYDYATGSAQPQITIDNIKNVPILIPSEGVLEHVDYLFESIYKKQWELIQESGDLAELRDTLLPRLMSGELKVGEVNV